MQKSHRPTKLLLFIRRVVRFFQDLLNYIKPMLTERQFLYLSCILVASSSAGAVILLKTFAHKIFSITTYLTQLSKFPYIKSIFPMIGILLTIWVVRKFLDGSIEKGTAQIMIAVAKRSGYMPRKQMYAQIITSSLTVGMGGSAGLESPITITGAAFGSNYARYYKFKYKYRTLLLACGVAAGIATAFNAPIAGVLFAIEVVLADMSVTAFIPLLMSSATGAILGNLVFKNNQLLQFTTSLSFDYSNTFYYILLGVLGGFLAIYHARMFRKVEHFCQTNFDNPYLKGIIGASFLGILIFIFPTLFGEGYESIKLLAENGGAQLLQHSILQNWDTNAWLVWGCIGIIMLVKSIATGLTLGSGGNGGNFAPSLFVGAYLGYAVSKFITLLGIKELPIQNFTVVGMAAVLSGLFHAPLTAIFLIAEMTSGYGLIVPLMIVSAISFAIAKRYDKYSMDVYNIANKGLVFTEDKDRNLMEKIELADIIQLDVPTLTYPFNTQDVRTIFLEHSTTFIPILNKQKEVLGIIYWQNIKDIFLQENAIAIQLESLISTVKTISLHSNISLHLKEIENHPDDIIFITELDQYKGYISKLNVLEGYRLNVKKLRIE